MAPGNDPRQPCVSPRSEGRDGPWSALALARHLLEFVSKVDHLIRHSHRDDLANAGGILD